MEIVRIVTNVNREKAPLPPCTCSFTPGHLCEEKSVACISPALALWVSTLLQGTAAPWVRVILTAGCPDSLYCLPLPASHGAGECSADGSQTSCQNSVKGEGRPRPRQKQRRHRWAKHTASRCLGQGQTVSLSSEGQALFLAGNQPSFCSSQRSSTPV